MKISLDNTNVQDPDIGWRNQRQSPGLDDAFGAMLDAVAAPRSSRSTLLGSLKDGNALVADAFSPEGRQDFAGLSGVESMDAMQQEISAPKNAQIAVTAFSNLAKAGKEAVNKMLDNK